MDLIARGLAIKAGSADSFISNVDQTSSNISVSKSQDGKIILTGDGGNALLINASSNTTVNGYQVPSLTSQEITNAYNYIVAGGLVIVSDVNGMMHFIVEQADSIGSDVIISLDYFDTMQLTYISDGTIEYVATPKILTFNNKTVSSTSWVSDTTYTEFGYKADIVCSGIDATYYSNVTFDVKEAISGNFAPVSLTGDNKVTIYAVELPTQNITIPSIVCSKGA